MNTTFKNSMMGKIMTEQLKKYNYARRFVNLDDPDSMKKSATNRCTYHHEQLWNLTKRSIINTRYSIISMTLSYDSIMAMTVLFDSHKRYLVRMYNLESKHRNMTHCKEYEIKGNYIKTLEIAQNDCGMYYSLPYTDDGEYWVLIFNQNEELDRLNVSKILNITDKSRTMKNVQNPMILSEFIACENGHGGEIFINVFHRKSLTHYHFVYSFMTKRVVTKPIKIKLNCTNLNFPHGCFYNGLTDEVYCFYRQG